MGKVIIAVIAVLGIWIGSEVVTEGPNNAFGGAFAGSVDVTDANPVDERTTAQRSGDAVRRAQDEAAARRERMLSQ